MRNTIKMSNGVKREPKTRYGMLNAAMPKTVMVDVNAGESIGSVAARATGRDVLAAGTYRKLVQANDNFDGSVNVPLG